MHEYAVNVDPLFLTQFWPCTVTVKLLTFKTLLVSLNPKVMVFPLIDVLVMLNWSLNVYKQFPVQTDCRPFVVRITFGPLLAVFKNR